MASAGSRRCRAAVNNEIIRPQQIDEKLAKQGLIVVGGTPDHLAEFILQDIPKWQRVVKEAGIIAE